MVAETAPGVIGLDAFRDRVKNGARLLDDMAPGWAEEINDDELAMQSCTDCILGQVFGNFYGGLHALDVRRGTAAAHGFTLLLAEVDNLTASPAWDVLADAWRIEIRARLAAPAPEWRKELACAL